MSTPLNKRKTYAAGVGAKGWFMLNRWSPSNYIVNIIISGVATVDLEGTMVQLNRGETTTASDIFVLPGGASIAASVAVNVADVPIEAIRINQTAGAGTVTMHIMQAGRDD
jgi:hypothetical protein